MDLPKNVARRERLTRVVAVGLAVVAIRSLWKGKRVAGLLAGAGAIALGYNVANTRTEVEGLVETAFGEGPTDEEVVLRCAICGQPIRPGQRRGPNADGEIVHDACEASAA